MHGMRRRATYQHKRLLRRHAVPELHLLGRHRLAPEHGSVYHAAAEGDQEGAWQLSGARLLLQLRHHARQQQSDGGHRPTQTVPQGCPQVASTPVHAPKQWRSREAAQLPAAPGSTEGGARRCPSGGHRAPRSPGAPAQLSERAVDTAIEGDLR